MNIWWRRGLAIAAACASVIGASAAAYGQPTHLWIGATAGAFATACGTLSTLLLLTKDNP